MITQPITTLPGLLIRPPLAEDIAAIAELFNLCSQEEQGSQEETVASIRQRWEGPGFSPVNDCRVVATASGQLVGVTHLLSQPPYVRTHLWGSTHPQWRGQGIGTWLMQWAEEQGRQRLAIAPAGTRVTLTVARLATFEPPVALLRDLGYRHKRSFYYMKIEFTDPPPQPQWPAGISVRTMQPGEEGAVYRAWQESFKDHWGHVETPFAEGFPRWEHLVLKHPDHDPTTFFLALAGEEIAGVALCFPKDVEFPELAWVDDVGVRRPWRRRGLALALLHHAFGEFYRRGIQGAALGVDASSLTGATKLYEKAGMHVFRQFDSYEKELRSGVDLSTQTAINGE
jgi:mycothiol synthase